MKRVSLISGLRLCTLKGLFNLLRLDYYLESKIT